MTGSPYLPPIRPRDLRPWKKKVELFLDTNADHPAVGIALRRLEAILNEGLHNQHKSELHDELHRLASGRTANPRRHKDNPQVTPREAFTELASVFAVAWSDTSRPTRSDPSVLAVALAHRFLNLRTNPKHKLDRIRLKRRLGTMFVEELGQTLYQVYQWMLANGDPMKRAKEEQQAALEQPFAHPTVLDEIIQ